MSIFEKMDQLEPLSVKELSEMANNQDELDKLYTLCWKYNQPRCYDVGIRNFVVKTMNSHYFTKNGKVDYNYYNVNWSDSGDPAISVKDMNIKIDRIPDRNMGEYSYGVYRKK